MLFARPGVGADYERLVVCQGPGGLRAIVAIHSTSLGPAFGGIRRRRYPSDASALAEVLGLAESMSRKCALAGLDAGGAKAVVLDHPDFEPGPAYRALGDAIDKLCGEYICGPDVGTGTAELAYLRESTSHVNPEANDAGASTAAGVLAGLRGLLGVLDGTVDLGRQHYVIQGLGSVGLCLARTLTAAGARVSGADLRPEARTAAAEAGVDLVSPQDAAMTPCDVFMPCALGNVLDREVAATIPCRGICGPANQQLADTDAAAVLHGRAIAHAPDIVVSAGAVIEGVLTVREGGTPQVRERVQCAIEGIERTTREILEDARRSGRTPTEVANARAVDRIRSGPGC